jgi:hypothetical protein
VGGVLLKGTVSWQYIMCWGGILLKGTVSRQYIMCGGGVLLLKGTVSRQYIMCGRNIIKGTVSRQCIICGGGIMVLKGTVSRPYIMCGGGIMLLKKTVPSRQNIMWGRNIIPVHFYLKGQYLGNISCVGGGYYTRTFLLKGTVSR